MRGTRKVTGPTCDYTRGYPQSKNFTALRQRHPLYPLPLGPPSAMAAVLAGQSETLYRERGSLAEGRTMRNVGAGDW